MATDFEYFSRRAREERAAESRAVHAHVRIIHRELAEAYERQVQVLSADIRRAEMHLVSAA
ncbi:hypothetical protein [Mycobacterium sp.]|jgi:hypothetical protein|uniref:hypothetical protein n=1 Tax=Mycobacterium sp. TaxID=1785 RepID=UPI002618A150|nr:hypothetical protein [Mycobacterium sp.]HWU92903.1 hypothetical protein [Sphingomicrobium sp.]